MSTNLEMMDKQARLWLLTHLDLGGPGADKKLDKATEIAKTHQVVAEWARKIMAGLAQLKPIEGLAPQQQQRLDQATDAVRQAVRQENEPQAESALKKAVILYKTLLQEMSEAKDRVKRLDLGGSGVDEKLDKATEIAKSNKAVAERARKILGGIEQLTPLQGVMPRQEQRLGQAILTVRQAVRKEDLTQAESDLKAAQSLYEALRQEIKERLARQGRHTKLPALAELSAGQQKRRDQSDEAYQQAEAEERPADAEKTLQDREALQKVLINELALVAKVKKTLQEQQDPDEANDGERDQLQQTREDIHGHLKEDRFTQADQAATRLTNEVAAVRKAIHDTKANAKSLASKLVKLVGELAASLLKGDPFLPEATARKLLGSHPAAKGTKDEQTTIQASQKGTVTRVAADEFAQKYDAMVAGLNTAAEALASALENDRAAMSLITKTLLRSEDYQDKTANPIDFVPSAWKSWPKTLPKPAQEDLPAEPGRQDLSDRLDKARAALEKAREAWQAGTAVAWDALTSQAEGLLNDSKKAWKDYYALVSKTVYNLLATRQQDHTQSLKNTETTIKEYFKEVSKGSKGKPVPLSEDHEKLRKIIDDRVSIEEKKSKNAKTADLRQTEVAKLIQEQREQLKADVEKAESQREQDGVGPKEVAQDPTHFDDETDYMLVGAPLQGKPVYARLDHSVTSDSNYSKLYAEAMSNGIIPSTSTGQAGIKKEPYGWVVKVTLSRAQSNQGVDNVKSPIASAGLRLSDSDDPAFYLNFDGWYDRH